jgi:hypothetical protein
MQTPAMHAHVRVEDQRITRPEPVGSARAALQQRLASLRPASRSFVARLFSRGRPAIRNEQLEFAQWMQTRMHYSAQAERQFRNEGDPEPKNFNDKPETQKFKDELGSFLQGLLHGKLDLSPANLFSAVEAEVGNPSSALDAPALLGAVSAKALLKLLEDWLKTSGHVKPQARAEELARVVYTAMVSKVASVARDKADEKIKGMWNEFVRIGMISSDKKDGKLESYNALLIELDKQALHSAIPGASMDWVALGKAIKSAMSNLDVRGYILDSAKGLVEKAGFDAEDLKNRLGQLDFLTSLCAATGADRSVCEEAIHAARAHLGVLKNFDRDQDALKEKLRLISGKAAPALNLHESLAELRTDRKPAAYVRARQALDHMLGQVPGASQDQVLLRLSDFVAPMGEHGRDQTYLLGLIHQGDADIIDRVFHGPEWHEDAWRLKAAAIPPGDERALKNLDVQHNLRIVAFELDRAMQHATLNQTGRGEFSSNPFSDLVRRLRKVDRPEDLPRNVFSATRPDAKLLGWFMRHAPGIVADRNLVIANWISLSCYDPATGTIDKSRTQPLFDTLRLQGLDPGHIEQYIQQGFRNGAAVVKCREQVCKFARALDDAKLLKEMEQARSVRYRAEELTQRLLREVIGTDPAGMSSEQIAERMKSGLKHAAPHATENMPAKLARLTVRREELLTEIMNGAGPLKSLGGDTKLDWIKSAGKLAEQVHLYQHALDALMYHDILSDSAKPAADRAAAEAGLQKHLGALKYFNILKLRENTDTLLTRRDRGLTPKTDIGSRAETIRNLRAIQGLLRPLRELAQVDSTIAAIRPMLIGSSAGDLFVERAMRVAILQEAVASGSVDFTPQAKAGAVLKRLASFGFQPGSSNENMRGLLRQATEHLTQNARSLEDLCKLYDVQEQARSARAAVTGKSDVRSALKGDVRKKRAENAKIIRSQFQDLGPDSSLAIRFGAFGELSVSLPVLFVLSVSSETQVQRDNAITISNEEVDGKSRYTLKLVGGASVRSGVSVDVIADLLSAKGFVGRGADQGFSFTFDDREACMNLALALAGGDPADPRLWQGASVQTDQAIGKGAGASIEAGLDLGVLALEAQAQIQGGREVSVQESAFGRTETYGRHFEATSSAAATLIGDLGDKEVEAGIDRTVTRTLKTALGMFAPDCELTVSARVVGGNLDRCLRYVLPPGLAGRIDDFRKELEGVDEGTQLFVRCGLDPQVRAQANELLAKAEKILLDATQGSREGAGRRHQAAREEARKLVVAAYALTERPGAYIPQGLGWTTQALVEVTSSRKVFDYFASSEALETRFLPFETPVGPLRDDVEV